MRILRYMLTGRFWTASDLVAFYGALVLIAGVAGGLLWLVQRLKAPGWTVGIIAALVMAVWVGVGVRLMSRRIRAIREEEDAGRYMP
jgi:hypothetical protein